MKRFIIIISILAGIVIVFCAALLIANTGILLSKLKIETPEEGTLLLGCDYFDGIGKRTQILMYKGGRYTEETDCPFFGKFGDRAWETRASIYYEPKLK